MFDSWPFPAAFAALFVVVMLRANATYWAGRAVAAGARKTSLSEKMKSAGYLRAEKVIQRWGAPAIAVSFLTIGFQTVMNAAAGVMRMPMRRYLAAVIVGGLMWALLYATIGLAVVQAFVGGAFRSWYVIVGAVLLIGVATLIFTRRTRTRSNSGESRAD